MHEKDKLEMFEVVPYSPHIGAEVFGIDLTAPLNDEQVAELRRLFVKYQVLFFRDQKISFDDQVRAASYFGTPGQHVGVKTISRPTDNPYVRRFHADETSKRVSGENFHSDQSCAEIPPLASMLYLHTTPPDGGGDTMFASMYAAYDALSERMKAYLEGLVAVHDGTRVFGPGTPVSTHPVVVRHPDTGRKLLFVNTDFVREIEGIPKQEAEALLAFLVQHCARAEWSCRFKWQPHSIALWDNRCTHHRAIWDYWPNVRSGYRVQIEGTEPPRAG